MCEQEKKEGGRDFSPLRKKININPSVVEMHVTFVTLKATSTNGAETKLGWKRKVVLN